MAKRALERVPVVAAWALLSLLASGCSSPCDQLAKDVCAKLGKGESSLCAEYKQKIAGLKGKSGTGELCKRQLKSVGRIVSTLRMGAKMKTMFQRLDERIKHKLKVLGTAANKAKASGATAKSPPRPGPDGGPKKGPPAAPPAPDKKK